MSIKVRLIIMNFLQFFVWGSWLISLGGYMGRELHFEGGQIGAIFATMGIASLVMPGIIGIIADKWFNAERLYGLCHIVGAACLFYASTATGYDQMYWAMLLNLLVYMPTLSLANTVSYNALEQYKCDLIKDFPPIRVWGTIGFICAMWAVDLTGFKNSSAQLYVGAISALLLGVYSFTLPACKPAKTENKSLLSAFGLDALVLFKRKKMAIFFLFSMLLGAALQITNTYGDLFLGSFAGIPEFADSFGSQRQFLHLYFASWRGCDRTGYRYGPLFRKDRSRLRRILVQYDDAAYPAGLCGVGLGKEPNPDRANLASFVRECLSGHTEPLYRRPFPAV